MAAFTQEQYDALCAAIAQGSLRVMYGDKMVEYRKLEDMFRIKNLMEADLGISSGKSSKVLSSFSKGLK